MEARAPPVAAKRAFGRIYAAWALSQDFYRAGLHLEGGSAPNLGAPDLESVPLFRYRLVFVAAPHEEEIGRPLFAAGNAMLAVILCPVASMLGRKCVAFE